MNLKIPGVAAQLLFVLCLPFLLLTASIGWAVNSLWLYEYGFQKYSISQSTGLAEPELDKAARGLITYFNSSKEYIEVTVVKDGQPFQLFNQREIDHLKDVKGLIRLDYEVLLGTLIYILAYATVSLIWQRRKYWRRLAQAVLGGSVLTLALMLALGLGILFNFDQLFWQFHLISFANDFWQLDPSRDYLIRLFPQGFWYDVALFCAMATAGMALILACLSGGHLLFNRNKPAG